MPSCFAIASTGDMVDPLSAGGTIIGVVSLTVQVIQILDRFVTDWKSAPDDVKGFKGELETLLDTLRRTERNPALKSVFGSSSAKDEITSCEMELCKLHDAMILPKNAWDQFKRAIRAESLLKSIEKVHRRCEQINHTVNLEGLEASLAGRETIDQVHRMVENRIRDEDKSRILSWISTTDFKNRHENLLQQHHEGTGEWLIKREDFIDWRNGIQTDLEDNEVRPILWCHGIRKSVYANYVLYLADPSSAGAGKSVMTWVGLLVFKYLLICSSSFVVEHCKRVLSLDPKPAIIYIYCDYKERNRQSTHSLMSSLLKQALLQLNESEGMPREAFDAYQEHAQGETIMRFSELQALLTMVLQHFYRSILVIDALDEYVDSDDEAHTLQSVRIFDELRKVMFDCDGTCRMFVTSRGNCYAQYQSKVQATDIEIVALEEDVRSYAHSFIYSDQFSHMEKVRKNEKLAQDITNSITKKARGQ